MMDACAGMGDQVNEQQGSLAPKESGRKGPGTVSSQALQVPRLLRHLKGKPASALQPHSAWLTGAWNQAVRKVQGKAPGVDEETLTLGMDTRRASLLSHPIGS